MIEIKLLKYYDFIEKKYSTQSLFSKYETLRTFIDLILNKVFNK